MDAPGARAQQTNSSIVGTVAANAFTWGWALSGHPDTLVTLVFRAKDGQTEITLTHQGLPTEEDRANHGKGWNSTLNKLALYVKGELV